MWRCVYWWNRLALFNKPSVNRRVDSDWFLLRQQYMKHQQHGIQPLQNPSVSDQSTVTAGATSITHTLSNNNFSSSPSSSSSLYFQDVDSPYSPVEYFKLKSRLKRLPAADDNRVNHIRSTSRMQHIQAMCVYLGVGVWTVVVLVGVASMSYQLALNAWKPPQIAPFT